jgi:hypothetical protein
MSSGLVFWNIHFQSFEAQLKFLRVERRHESDKCPTSSALLLVTLAVMVVSPARASKISGVVRYTRLYVGADGLTHLQDCTVQNMTRSAHFGTAQYVRDLGDDLRPTDLTFTQQTGDNPWHFCPHPQMVVTLSGSWFVNTTDGNTVVFEPGDVLYQDDCAANPGQGKHYSAAIGGPCNQLCITVNKKPKLGDSTCDWVDKLLN